VKTRARWFGTLAATTFGRLLILGWTIVAVLPFILILLLSLRNDLGIYANPLGLGGQYVFGNYTSAWTGPPGTAGMSSFIVNTATAAATSLLVILAVGVPAGYFLTKVPNRARGTVQGVLIACTVLPLALVIIPYYQAYNALHMLNEPAALGVAYGALALPTTVLLLQTYFIDFPADLLEASVVDGLGEWGSYFRVVLPLSKGPVTAVCMLTLLFVWGEGQIGLVLLQSAASQTISVGLLGYQGEWITQLGPEFAGLVIGIGPVLILYVIFNRYITKGIALGGVFR
jgi:raffinose/stachyose/melibiose transport system permease protein